ncbi:MAG: hypothetical protein KDD60_09125, partial [Bdellovibrionales bacterium]|nr:hypothetical protein [Bdellovibrionales bacterium]
MKHAVYHSLLLKHSFLLIGILCLLCQNESHAEVIVAQGNTITRGQQQARATHSDLTEDVETFGSV